MTEVMRKGLFVFLEYDKASAQGGRLPHAELQIVDYLYFQRQDLLNQAEPIYIGVSKKCCGNCEHAIQALNQLRDGKVVTVRGEGHGFNFLAGIPRFLKNNPQLQQMFLLRRNVASLEAAFVNDPGRISGDDQLLTPSSSLYEDSSVQESTTVSHEEESTEADMLPPRSSTAKILKVLQSEPMLPVLPVPRSPQKPKPEPTAKQQNKAVKKSVGIVTNSDLSAPSLMFTPQVVIQKKGGKETASQINHAPKVKSQAKAKKKARSRQMNRVITSK